MVATARSVVVDMIDLQKGPPRCSAVGQVWEQTLWVLTPVSAAQQDRLTAARSGTRRCPETDKQSSSRPFFSRASAHSRSSQYRARLDTVLARILLLANDSAHKVPSPSSAASPAALTACPTFSSPIARLCPFMT